jgi:hypothetical protein
MAENKRPKRPADVIGNAVKAKWVQCDEIWPFTALLCFMLTSEARAQALPKVGTCSSGDHSSGSACIPNPQERSARPDLPKVETCPFGHHPSGDYCLGSSENAKHAIPKTGACPSGYHDASAYCLSNR